MAAVDRRKETVNRKAEDAREFVELLEQMTEADDRSRQGKNQVRYDRPEDGRNSSHRIDGIGCPRQKCRGVHRKGEKNEAECEKVHGNRNGRRIRGNYSHMGRGH